MTTPLANVRRRVGWRKRGKPFRGASPDVLAFSSVRLESCPIVGSGAKENDSSGAF
jgi:hypothetical protein